MHGLGLVRTAALLLAGACGREACPSPCDFHNRDDRDTTGKQSTNGEVAVGHFPWHAIITRGEHFYGGSLIHPQYVLTAADFIASWESLQVYFGVVDVSLINSKSSSVKMYKPSNVWIHPAFGRIDLRNFDNDIALMLLDSAVSLSANVYPIRLATELDFLTEYDHNVVLRTVGTGQDNGTEAHNLTSGDLLTVEGGKCRSDVYQIKAPQFLCVKSQPHACKADAGSGVIGDPNCYGRNVLVGILSRPPNRRSDGGLNYTCVEDSTELVTRVAPYVRSWISNQIDLQRDDFYVHTNSSITTKPTCSDDWCTLRHQHCPPVPPQFEYRPLKA